MRVEKVDEKRERCEKNELMKMKVLVIASVQQE